MPTPDIRGALASPHSWAACEPAIKQAIAVALADGLGSDYEACDELCGGLELAMVKHLPTALYFLAIPGGMFRLGMSDEEIEDIVQVLATPSTETHVRDSLMSHIAECRPVHEVSLPPFLCARTHLTAVACNALDPDGTTDPEEIAELAANDEEFFEELPVADWEGAGHLLGAVGWRMLSNAEWEWVARACGRRSWIIDLPDNAREPESRGMKLDMCNKPDAENPLGIRCLMSMRGEWVADGWLGYTETPRDGAAAETGDEWRVHRGAHTCWQDDMEGVTCHASLREKWPYDEECGVRAAIDLTL